MLEPLHQYILVRSQWVIPSQIRIQCLGRGRAHFRRRKKHYQLRPDFLGPLEEQKPPPVIL